MWVLGVLVICFVAICFILIPPSRGVINPILDEEGKEVNGSISEKTVLDVNGTQLGIILLGRDENKPVLLFLAGGPGIPEYFLEYQYPSHLEDEFVVCFLEYRGTTRSYNSKLDKSTMTTEQYIDDVVDVTKYLCQRFGQEKVYLMAHSFGTYIGLNTINLYPELFYAYIPIAQMCNQKESEIIAYDYMLEHYRQIGDKNKINSLKPFKYLKNSLDFDSKMVLPF
jgi:pimeloyl-ACP methyl ester carboxylesterase